MDVTAHMLDEHLAMATARLRAAQYGVAMVETLIAKMPSGQVLESDELAMLDQLHEIGQHTENFADYIEDLHHRHRARRIAIAREG